MNAFMRLFTMVPGFLYPRHVSRNNVHQHIMFIASVAACLQCVKTFSLSHHVCFGFIACMCLLRGNCESSRYTLTVCLSPVVEFMVVLC